MYYVCLRYKIKVTLHLLHISMFDKLIWVAHTIQSANGCFWTLVILYMVNFIRYHKNWCKTCTPFEKDLRRYSDWEGAPCMCWDGFEKVIWWVMREIWEGSEKVFWLRRSTLHVLRWFWEGFIFEKDLRSMELLQSSWDGFEIWDGSEKEMYPPVNLIL